MKRIHIILIIGLIHGLIYVFLVPPWQHYDEPGHFEYVWLIGNRQRLPKEGDYDQNMRMAVGKSLLDSSFFTPENRPNLTDPSQPLWIGLSQVKDPPLYYVIEAVPFYFLRGFSINTQLYAGRILSLSFLLISVYCSYLLLVELTPANHPLQWMVPIFIVLLPGFVEFMSAINDHVAAIGLFSLWLLFSVKLIKTFSFKYAGILILLTLACFFTQKILLPTLIYLPFVLLLSVFPKNKKYLGWMIALIVVIVGLFIVFKWSDAALWLRANFQEIPSRARLNLNGQRVNALQSQVYPDNSWVNAYDGWKPGFYQLVPSNVEIRLRGKTITVGAWVWSMKQIHGYGPGINSFNQFDEHWLGFKPELLSAKPKFIASVIELPAQQDRLQVWLRSTSADGQEAINYFTGVIMLEGEWPVDKEPQFTTRDGSQGLWDGKPFINLIRNSKFNGIWPFLQPSLNNFITSKYREINPVQISSFISLLMDYPGTKWYIDASSRFIFQSFWAKFCWGQVPLISNTRWLHPYFLLSIFTLVGIAGAIFTATSLYKTRKNEFSYILMIMLATMLVAFLYGVYTMGGALRYRAYIPTARYIFPAIIPIATFLGIGWYGILMKGSSLLKLPEKISKFLFIGILAILDLYSFLSLIVYFG
jgi:hypothetical protein